MISEKELNEALSQATESIIKGLQAFGQLVNDIVTDVCEIMYNALTKSDIEEIIKKIKSHIEKQDPKFDKNISHFKYISERNYDNPYYRIEPKARTHCR